MGRLETVTRRQTREASQRRAVRLAQRAAVTTVVINAERAPLNLEAVGSWQLILPA